MFVLVVFVQYLVVGLNVSGQCFKIFVDWLQINYVMCSMLIVQNEIQVGVVVSYEFDLFGCVWCNVEVVQVSFEQVCDDFVNVCFVLSVDFVLSYFVLCEFDIEIDVVKCLIDLQQKVLDYVSVCYDFGVVLGFDLLQQCVQFDVMCMQV